MAPATPAPPAPAPAPEAAPEPVAERPDPLAGIDERVERVRNAYKVPGLAVAVVYGGEVVLAKGYGVRALGKPEPVDENTVFAIASNTKAFAATAVALAVHDGKLGWDDRVKERLPSFRMNDDYATGDMRVRDLLSHRSGLDTWAGDLAWIGAKTDTASLMKRLRHVEPRYGVRSKYGYTNLMFMVAGEVLREVTGKPWDSHVQDRILTPLGMNRTSVLIKGLEGLDNVATPHQPDGEGLLQVPYLDVDPVGAAASMNSSVADLSRWLLLQTGYGTVEGKEVVPEDVVRALWQPHTPLRISREDLLGSRHFSAYGLGWFLYDYHGNFVVTHSGGLPGMTSRTTIVPELGLGVVVLTNSESGASNLVAYDIVDAYMGVPARDYVALIEERRARWAERKKANGSPKADAPGEKVPPSSAAGRHAGKYRNPLLGRAVVTLKDGKLRLSVPEHGGLDCDLQHESGDAYTCDWDNPIMYTSTVRFDVKGGSVKALRFRVRPSFIDPVEYVFRR